MSHLAFSAAVQWSEAFIAFTEQSTALPLESFMDTEVSDAFAWSMQQLDFLAEAVLDVQSSFVCANEMATAKTKDRTRMMTSRCFMDRSRIIKKEPLVCMIQCTNIHVS